MILRDLNYSLGCSPLGTHAYREPPFLKLYDTRIFGVGQWTEGFLPLNPKSVSLPFWLSPLRLDYGQFWQEPAIAELDWLFTPSPRLEKHLYVALLQASTKSYLCFTLPRVRSLGFGSYPSNLRHFHTSLLASCELFGFPMSTPLQITLAT